MVKILDSCCCLSYFQPKDTLLMSKNRFTLHKDHTKILEVIKKNIDDESIEKRQTLEKLLNKMSVKFYKSKLH